MERRLGIMQSVEPVLENAIKTLQKVVDVRGMGKKWAPWSQFYTNILNLVIKSLHPHAQLVSQDMTSDTNVILYLS